MNGPKGSTSIVTAVFVPSENSQLHEQYKTIDVIHGTNTAMQFTFHSNHLAHLHLQYFPVHLL